MLPRTPRRARSTLPVADLSWQGGSPDVRGLLTRMEQLRGTVDQAARALLRQWRAHLRMRVYQPSATNLAAYIALRRHDLRPIQGYLAALGLSSLGRCEGHVMATLDAVIHALRRMQGARVARLRIARVAREIARDPARLRRRDQLAARAASDLDAQQRIARLDRPGAQLRAAEVHQHAARPAEFALGATHVADHAAPGRRPVMRAIDARAVHALPEGIPHEGVVAGGLRRQGDHEPGPAMRGRGAE